MTGPMTGRRFGDPDNGGHEPWDSHVVGYALHALEPQEEVALEAHLTGCTRCTAAVTQMADTAADLADAVDLVTPPAALRAAVLHAFPAATSAGSAGGFPGPNTVTGADFPARPAPGPTEPASDVPIGSSLSLSAARLRRQLARAPRGLALIAASVALVVATGVGIGALVKAHDANRQLDRTSAMLACVQEQGCRTVPLTTGPLDNADRGTALMRGSSVTLVVRDLPNNDPESVYVLWQKQRSGEVLPVGAFDVGRPITVSPTMQLRDVADMAMLAVTKEPGRAPPAAPTSAPVAVAAVT